MTPLPRLIRGSYFHAGHLQLWLVVDLLSGVAG